MINQSIVSKKKEKELDNTLNVKKSQILKNQDASLIFYRYEDKSARDSDIS